MKLKVAQLACVYPPYGGGIGRVAYDYAAWLKDDYQVTVFTPRYQKSQTFLDNPGVSLLAFRPTISLGKATWWLGFNSWLKYFDIIHLHYPWFGVHEWLAYLPDHIKLIVSYHMKPEAKGLKGQIFDIDRRWFENRLFKRADVLLCSTNDYLTKIVKPPAAMMKKWRIVPFAASPSFKPAEVNLNLKEELGIKSGEAVILFVGTLDKAHYFKGLQVLLRAAVKLTEPFKLLVVGDGNYLAYKKLSQHLGLSDKVVFTGYVSDKKLPDYYNLSDMLVFPSLNQSESFGLVALQAMASAKPVIASRLIGVQELVRDKETGYLVEPADVNRLSQAINQMLNSPTLLFKYGQAGLQRVNENYTVPIVSSKLKQVYKSLL